LAAKSRWWWLGALQTSAGRMIFLQTAGFCLCLKAKLGNKHKHIKVGIATAIGFSQHSFRNNPRFLDLPPLGLPRIGGRSHVLQNSCGSLSPVQRGFHQPFWHRRRPVRSLVNFASASFWLAVLRQLSRMCVAAPAVRSSLEQPQTFASTGIVS